MNTDPSAPRRPQILIVDDDPGMVHVLARAMMDMGQLHFAVRGNDGLLKAMDLIPDVMLVDAEMPDLNGFDLIRRLRDNPATAHTRVIMVSAHTDAARRSNAYAVGVDDYLSKPVDRDALRERVGQLLQPQEMETLELSGDSLFSGLPPGAEAEAPAKPGADGPAWSGEVFQQVSVILEATTRLRTRLRAQGDKNTLEVDQIEEACAEIVQYLVSLTDDPVTH
jgi:DNA-binding response OmpR family regulator